MVSSPCFLPSSALVPQWSHDVFLSFRGEDTRKSFISHVYDALKKNGINTFKDDKKLQRGKIIAPELSKAIQESRFSVVVLSHGYASSTWCLNELVQIVECKKKMGNEIFPVFYDVSPSQVRKLAENFQDAVRKTEEVMDLKTIRLWMSALAEVSNICGWDVQSYRSEVDVIKEIVQIISSKLSPAYSSIVDGLIGIDARFNELNSMINREIEDVRMIGICGMGGLGKTTLARVAYDLELVPNHFEGKSFLADVREVSGKSPLDSLQKQLLSEILKEEFSDLWNAQSGVSLIRKRLCYKKVLLVVDDVDHTDQLKYLVGNRNWFGSGSKIIITSRDEHLLRAHGVNDIYRPSLLNEDEGLHLLSLKAFKRDQPHKDFMELCKAVVRYAGGLPLALEVFGSFLYGRNKKEWNSAIKKIKQDSGKGLLDRLQISFDGLDDNERSIFLDIACFFKGMNKNYVAEIIDGCNLYAEIGLRILIERSLISIEDNKLRMHDFLQEMGWKIVRQESLKEPGKRSRLWDTIDISHVLTENTGTMAVEGIKLDPTYHGIEEKVHTNCEAFSNMKRLRLLKIQDVLFSHDLTYLSSELRLLEWHGYPSKSLPVSFVSEKLVILDMRSSCLEKLWEGVITLHKLKSINLSDSRNLKKIPDLTMALNLESLNLEGCTRLLEMHPSIQDLKRLTSLNLKDCKSLKSLPRGINGLKSLKTLNLSGCFKLEDLPEELGEVIFLKELDLSRTSIRRLPSCIFYLPNLEVLSFRGCKGRQSNLRNLLFLFHFFSRKILVPMAVSLPSLSGLHSLKQLDLSDCNLCEGALPNDIGSLSLLTKLNLSNNNFVSLPSSIGELPKLDSIELKNCKRLQSLPPLSGFCLLSTDTDLTGNKQLSNLVDLYLKNHRLLLSFLELPGRIMCVRADGCISLEPMSGPLKLIHVLDNGFSLLGGIKVMANQVHEKMSLTVLKKYLEAAQENPHEPPQHDCVLPGSRIPKWFSHQSEGDSVKVKVPFKLQSNNDWMGFGLSVIFKLHNVNQRRQQAAVGSRSRTHHFYCSLSITYPQTTVDYGFSFYEVSAHTYQWICYLARGHHFFRNILGENWNEFGFRVMTNSPHVEAKRCGIRALYKNDMNSQELIKGISPESRSNFILENYLDQYNEGLGEAFVLSKRSHDDDLKSEESPPKRFKIN